jgi:hypothetical protein
MKDERWLRTVIPVGVLYSTVGIVSANLAGAAASDQMRFFGGCPPLSSVLWCSWHI